MERDWFVLKFVGIGQITQVPAQFGPKKVWAVNIYLRDVGASSSQCWSFESTRRIDVHRVFAGIVRKYVVEDMFDETDLFGFRRIRG